MFELARRYEFGDGVEENDEEAVAWYRRAAAAGDYEAMYELGKCYRWGIGVKKDLNEAIKWYGQSAEAGHSSAKITLKRLARGRNVG